VADSSKLVSFLQNVISRGCIVVGSSKLECAFRCEALINVNC